MSRPSFFAELKRRNVYRVAAMYAVAGWLLVQVATQVFPFFDVPNSAVRLVVILIAMGFPIALVVSWIYDLTPQGIVRTDDAATDPQAGRASAQLINRAIISLLLLAVVVLLAKVFWPQSATKLPVDETAKAAPISVTTTAINAKSIAVLPFANLSSDKDNAYFAEGIQDEILTRLSKIGALKVISRTSTAHYASSPDNLPEIAKQLGVANILEGSVQKSGDQVRINVQLIQAGSDSHLWAETYDRKITDIFSIQTEVAKAIAEALQATLTGGEQQELALKPTNNPAAYDAYLRGLALLARTFGGSPEPVRRAKGYFEDAVRLDPTFALAWTQLSFVKSYMCFNLIDRTPALLSEAKLAVDTAFKLQPEMGEAYVSLGFYRYWGLLDFDAGLEALEQASRRLPNNATVLFGISLIERRQGKWQEAIGHGVEAISIDPRNIPLLSNLSSYYLALRRYSEAHATLDRALDVTPDDTDLLAYKTFVYQAQGDLDAAEQLLARFPPRPDSPNLFQAQMQQLLYRRRYDALVAMIRAAVAQPELTSLGSALGSYYGPLGFALHLSGDEAAARPAFTRALQILRAAPEGGDAQIHSSMAYCHAGLGDKPAALREARRGVEINANDTVNKPQAEIIQAQVQAWVGDTDAAIAALPHLLQVPNGLSLAQLHLDPLWDPLRKDPRFQKLIADGEAAAKP